MNDKNKTKISKFLSLILRHQPEVVGLKLDENGWVSVEKLIKACAGYGKKFSLAELKEVVETNDKKRFAFDETGKKSVQAKDIRSKSKSNLKKKCRPKFFFTARRKKMSARFMPTD